MNEIVLYIIVGDSMDSNRRREKILATIRTKDGPIKGTDLAKIFNVSRQIIVQDIAILRAAGENILATPQGYLCPFSSSSTIKKTIACHHRADEMFDELAILIDNGAKVLDVTVDHPIYGEIKAMLMLNSRKDLVDFINSFKKLKAEPLSSLTGGVHIHTIEVEDESTYEDIILKLKKEGFLVEEE